MAYAGQISSTEYPTMADKDPKKLYVCPYNKYHRITALGYPMHIINCRKQYTGTAFKSCPFNARHNPPAVEYEYHIFTCPDKSFIERELASVPAPNVPPVNHHPEWNQPAPTEDWDLEADQPGFSLGSVTGDEPRTSYDVMEDYQVALQSQAAALPQIPITNGDLSGMSKAQKKNMKRAQKRREKKMAEVGDEDDTSEDDAQEMSPEETEQRLREIAREYALPGMRISSDAFVDWVSILNQYCQQNKVNAPKYSEAPNALGGFGAAVVVTTERFFSNTACRTKKEAKHSAARAALLGLNIAVSTPDPCRAPHQRGGNVHRIRELEANRQMLEHTIHANQQRVIPGLSQPTSPPPSQQQNGRKPQNSSENGTERITNQMAGVAIGQTQNPDDEWQLVGRRPRDSGRVPAANNNALRLAGRGRGRGISR